MTTIKEYSPEEVAELLKSESIVLVDVRENGEFASERIRGAILCPLSTFDPKRLPDSGGKPIVFHCAGGVRSARAVGACLSAGLPHNAHMAGGISAWKRAGLPVER